MGTGSKVVRESVSPRFRVFHVHRSRKNCKAITRLFFVRYPAAFITKSKSIDFVTTIYKKIYRQDAVHSWKIDTQIERHKYRGQVNKIRALFKAIFDAFSLVRISRPKYCLFVSQQLSKTRRPPTRDLSIGIVRIKHHLNVVFGPKGFGAFFLTNDMHS